MKRHILPSVGCPWYQRAYEIFEYRRASFSQETSGQIQDRFYNFQNRRCHKPRQNNFLLNLPD